MTYGTSITHGAAATGFHLSYAATTARLLGTDLVNVGVGGACRAEAAFADHIASRTDWDIASLALSVNMATAGFTLDEFERRVTYLIDRVSSDGRPVACISLYPFYADIMGPVGNMNAPASEFRRVLEDSVARLDRPNLHFIPGPEILTDYTGLTTDLIHPSDIGMIEMGANLSARLKPLLNE